MLNKKFFQIIRTEVRDRFRKHIFDPAGGGADAKDVFNRSYPNYTDNYKIAKVKGEIKAGGKGGKPQDLKFKNSNAPVLHGDLFKSFDTSGLISNGFGFGTLTEQAKVKSLAKQKRFISTNAMPLPNSVGEFIVKEADKYFYKRQRKIKGGKFNI